MGHAFKCCLPPSNASVTLASLVSSSCSVGCWYNNMNRLSLWQCKQYSLNVIVQFWFLTGESEINQPIRFSRCYSPKAVGKISLHPSSICTTMSFASKGQLSLEKVKAESYKSHISFKDQHFLMGFKPYPTWCYICHRNIWSGHFESNASCYDRWHAVVKSQG